MEKSTLNNFVNLSIMVCLRLHYEETVQIFETVLAKNYFVYFYYF